MAIGATTLAQVKPIVAGMLDWMLLTSETTEKLTRMALALRDAERMDGTIARLHADIASAEAENATLKAALEPFANIEIGPIDFRDGYVKRVPNEWISRARATLQKDTDSP